MQPSSEALSATEESECGTEPDPTNEIQLLILDADPESAQHHIQSLTNAELPFSIQVAQDLDKFQESLQQRPPELVLCNCTNHPFPPEDVMACLGPQKAHIHTVFLDKESNSHAMRQALLLGARDTAANDDSELLVLICQRATQDIYAQRQNTQLQRQAETQKQRYHSLIVQAHNPIAHLQDAIHIQTNSAYLNLFGFMGFEELDGLTLFDLVDPQEHASLKRLLQKLTRKQEAGEINLQCRRSNGRTFSASFSFSPAILDDEDCLQLIVQDVSEELSFQEKANQLSSEDPDTGLDNQEQFLDCLNQEVTGFQKEGAGTLYYICLDQMQEIQHQLGTDGTQRFLQENVELISQHLEPGDHLARLGNHTFGLFTPRHDKGATGILAAAICNRVHTHTFSQLNILSSPPSCSIGLSYGHANICHPQEFIEQAYRACEQARQSGGNAWRVFVYDDKANAEETQRILNLIDTALETDRFRLNYQPVVSLKGDTREHYAIFVRMLGNVNDSDTLLPEIFIDFARNNGRMADIDRWIIRHAIQEVGKQRAKGRKLNLFVQLSVDAIKQDDLLIWVCDCLRLHNAKGSWLTFQLSEHDIRSNTQKSRNLINGLKKISCRLAIDHFGDSEKHISLLKHLPVDFVKLSTRLTHNLSQDPKRLQQLREVLATCQTHGTKTIATEIEGKADLPHLWNAGVHYLQGYFLHEPSDRISFDLDLD